ncbi:hypothetical protein HFP57_05175 [Parasphingopyxis algicola]|uniref:hypothetical protein n=1 Tax=Parasphingopyxis algicola TaxID=2026624 RepID=UPI0015A4265F|nr:hypothetical protein [Parasphingopyxis algicola]QLC24471.1 hypothetical protein HFP57_05175 [Parasphingopyxis algicola]
MSDFIIINDSNDENVAGDICIYESRENALRALEIYDIEDDCILIYELSGLRLKLAYDQKNGTLEFESNENRFEGLRNVLLNHIEHLGLDIETHNLDKDELARIIFRYDPNPHAG